MTVEEPASTEEPEDAEAVEPRGFGSLGSIIGALMLCWAAALGLNPLNDNSFFTHLATGRLILEERSVPTVDPYTFTAQGEAWTVQSWLASVAYAGAERLGGEAGLRLLVVIAFVATALVLWHLTRPAASIFSRAALMAAAMLVATDLWTERPYMVGVIGIGLVWLALEGRVRPWVLVPYLWMWVNTHGSFPLATVLCVAVIAGELLDGRGDRPLDRAVADEGRVLLAVVVGSVAGALSPLGIRALTFPLRSITDQGSFAQIVEWQAPEFTDPGERLFLVLGVLAIVAVVASPRWRHALPLLLFLVAALLARRNLAMALPVLVAVIAGAAPDIGTLKASARPRGGAILTGAVGLFLVAVVVAGLQQPVRYAFGGYPATAIAFLDGDRGSGNLVTQDFTGNLLEVLDGPTGAVFIDDRADMFPSEVLADYQTLNDAGGTWDDVLDRYDVTSVVWSASHQLSTVLTADRRWMVVYRDSNWMAAQRR